MLIHVLTNEYFIYYPFYVLQIMYLITDNHLIGTNSYDISLKIYQIISSQYPHKSDVFFFPYSDTNYMIWNVSFILESLSHPHTIISSLNEIDEMDCSSQSISYDIYDAIQDTSQSLSQILSKSEMNEILEYSSDSVYLYGQKHQITDDDEYIIMGLSEDYTDNNTLIELLNTLDTISILDNNLDNGGMINLMLFTFNQIYITQECFINMDQSEYGENKYDDDDDTQNITTTTKMIQIMVETMSNDQFDNNIFSENVGNRRRQIDQSVTLGLKWRLSNETLQKLNQSESFNIYCQELDTEINMWLTDTCASVTEMIEITGNEKYFECKCIGNGQGTYGLAIDIEYDSSLTIDDPHSNILAMDTDQWLVFLILYALLVIAYVGPLIYFPKLSPKYYRCTDIQAIFCALIIIANIDMQLITCVAAIFVTNNRVKLWQFQVAFALQCGCLGVYNLFLLIIVNDEKCQYFKICKCIPANPLMITIINAIITIIILIFMTIHAICINLHSGSYQTTVWALWVVYIGLCGLTILFITYLTYYWYKGKNFSGGKPFAYTEGTRETTAIFMIIAGIFLYCLCIINAYFAYDLGYNLHKESDILNCMLTFQSLHWLSLLCLAGIICIVRKFEQAEKNNIIQTNEENKY